MWSIAFDILRGVLTFVGLGVVALAAVGLTANLRRRRNLRPLQKLRHTGVVTCIIWDGYNFCVYGPDWVYCKSVAAASPQISLKGDVPPTAIEAMAPFNTEDELHEAAMALFDDNEATNHLVVQSAPDAYRIRLLPPEPAASIATAPEDFGASETDPLEELDKVPKTDDGETLH